MSGGHISLKPKRLSETCFGSQPFDFAASMAAGETISSKVITASVYQGVDPSPALILSGPSQTQNVTQVIQLFTGGVLGCIYQILCQATTNLGQILSQVAYLAVIPDAV